MTKVSDLEVTLVRVGFGFVLLLFLVKLSMRKVNGFDVLSVVLLASASVESLLGTTGQAIQITLFAFTMAVIAKESGANRRGMLFISTLLLFSEVMIKYRKFLKDDIEDLNPCTPILIGASVQALLLAMILYASAGEDEGYGRKSTEEVAEELKVWLAVVLLTTTIHGFVAAYECDKGRGKLADLFDTLRVPTLAAVCITNGEDETTGENDV